MRASLVAHIAITLLIAAGFYLLLDQLLRDSRTETYQATEETLVDTANVLAALVQSNVKNDRPDFAALHDAVTSAQKRIFSAKIQSLEKTHVGLQVYVTDDKGIVLYDSTGAAVGKDYSKWNDVLLTLKGEYGARSSRLDPNDPATSVLHIGAPIYQGEKIIGALSVVKGKSDQAAFLSSRRSKILTSGLLIGGGLLLLVGAVFFWLFRPMRLLADYAQKITSGSRPSLPHLGLGREARILGDAIESMREKLEGREYAGQYVRTLTHELKSPLAAIQGASELLMEPMPEEQRAKFLGNIRLEAERAERMIRRLLRLSEVERMKSLQTTREVSAGELMKAVAAEAQPLTSNRNITLQVIAPETEIMLSGSPELLHSALINLVENAIDFSPVGGRIEFRFVAPNQFQVTDEGPGIPEYAKPRLFERFYSLKQSQVGRRGTGLGLCFVKEVANLHGGDVTLENRADQPVTGAVATLSIGGPGQ